jgi:hypothetical protein
MTKDFKIYCHVSSSLCFSIGIKRFDAFGRMQVNKHYRLILKEFRSRLKIGERFKKYIKLCYAVDICLQKRMMCLPVL